MEGGGCGWVEESHYRDTDTDTDTQQQQDKGEGRPVLLLALRIKRGGDVSDDDPMTSSGQAPAPLWWGWL